MNFNSLIPELYVSNFKNSLNFYINALGFSINYQRKEEGFAFLSIGKAQIMIEEINKESNWKTGKLNYPLGKGINFQIEVKNVDKIISKLKEKDIKLFRPLEEKWYRKDKYLVGNKQFLVQDPDGYLLRFFEDIGSKKISNL